MELRQGSNARLAPLQKFKRKLQLLILFSALIPIASYSQTTWPPPGTYSSIMRDFQDLSTKQAFKAGSAVDASDQSAGHDKMQGGDATVIDDYNCPNNSCTGGATTSQFIEGNKESYPVAALIPPTFGAITDNLWSPTAANLVNSQMSGSAVVQAAAIALTEPAVMAGIDFAVRTAMDYHKLNLMTGTHAAAMAQTMPSSQEFLKLYINCMQTTYEKGGMSYSESQSRCLRDGGLPSALATTPGQVLGGAPVLNMNFGTDTPAAQAASAIPTPSNSGKLSKLLFDQHIFAFLPGTVSHDNIRKLRDDFIKFFGDIEYTIGANTTTSAVSPRLTAKVESIAPTWTHKDNVQLRMHERWDLMRIVLYSYCDWFRTQQSTIAANNGPTDALPVNAWADLFSSTTGSYRLSTDIFQKISVKGYTWTPQEFDTMFREIEEEPRLVAACQTFFGNSAAVLPYCPFTVGAIPGPPPAGPACITTFPTRSYHIMTNLGAVPVFRNPYTETPIEEYLRTTVSPVFQQKIPAIFKTMEFAARQLSKIEIYQESLIALGLVRRLSSEDNSGIGGTLLSRAEELIYTAAGTREIESELQKESLELVNFLDKKKEELERKNAGTLLSIGHLPINQ